MISLQTLKPSYQDLDQKIVKGTDFILTHFKGSLFPRTISTKTTDNKQILIYSKEEAIARFKQANFLDCRINAFPSFTEVCKIPVDIIFIDLDLSNFKTKKGLEIELSNTLKNITEKKVRIIGQPISLSPMAIAATIPISPRKKAGCILTKSK